MKSLSIAHAWKSQVLGLWAESTARDRAWSPSSWSTESLETRLALSATAAAAAPAIQMISASTADSKSVTIEYQVNQPISTATPLQFGVYRSSDTQFDSSDAVVDTYTLIPPARLGPGRDARPGRPIGHRGRHARAHDPLAAGLAPLSG